MCKLNVSMFTRVFVCETVSAPYAQEGSVLYRCTDCILKKFDLCEKCFKDGQGEKHLQQFGPEHRLVKETESVTRAKGRCMPVLDGMCVCEHTFMYIGVCAHRTTVEPSDVESSFCEQNYSY